MSTPLLTDNDPNEKLKNELTVGDRLSKTLIAYGINHVAYFLTQILTLPILLSIWGKDVLSNWTLISTIPAYLTVADMGFGQALGNELSIRWARKEYEEALRSYQSGLIFVTGSCAVFALLFLAFVHFVPVRSLLRLNAMSQGECELLLILIMLQVLIAQIQGVFRSVFRTEGLASLSVSLYNLGILCNFINLIGIGIFHASPITFAAISTLISAVATAVFYVVGRRHVPWIHLGWEKASLERIRKLFIPAISLNLLPIGTALNLQGTLMVLSAVAGPQTMLVFSSTRTATRVVNQLTNTIEGSFIPEFAPALSSGNFDLATKLHHRSSQLSIWLSMGVSLLVMIVSRPAYMVWTHGKLEYEWQLFAILLAAMIINGAYYGSTGLLLAVNKHMKYALYFIIVSAVGLPICYGLSLLGHELGAAWAVLLGEVAIFCYVVPSAVKVSQDTFPNWIKASSSLDFSWITARLKRKRLTS